MHAEVLPAEPEHYDIQTSGDGTYGFIEDFVRDAEAGRLPSVVWVDPGFTFNDDHPPHDPALGQEFIRRVYEALAGQTQGGAPDALER